MKKETVEKAFALACRILTDFIVPPEAGWKQHLLERAESEPICRICGCTQENACPGGCHWAKPNLCSQCVTNKEPGE